MPVRQIPKQFRSLTGRFASSKGQRGVAFESSLERDLAALLEFDSRILAFEEQPLHVPFRGQDGKAHIYTPDFLVTYIFYDPETDPEHKCLVEVKYRQDLEVNWTRLRPSFRAALALAAGRGWRFKILTETEIRAPFLRPVRFLLPYLREDPNAAVEALVMEVLERQAARPWAKPKIEHVLWEAGRRVDAGEALRSLWRLVATGRIGMDFTRPFTIHREVWPADPPGKGHLLVPLRLPGLYRG